MEQKLNTQEKNPTFYDILPVKPTSAVVLSKVSYFG